MADEATRKKYKQLIKNGFCIFDQVLDPTMLDRVRMVSDQLLNRQSQAHFREQKSTGSMVSVFDDVFFAELVSYPPALSILFRLGFDQPIWSSGYIISKPPGSPALFWHQDWWGWNHPCSYKPIPQQIFLMYYLADTTKKNGCLRVISGSHLKRHPMHNHVDKAHTDELRSMVDPEHPAYQPVEGELDIPVKAGDLVIGDSRLLHAAHGNSSDYRRTVITLWYLPLYYQLPEPIQAFVGRNVLPEKWLNSDVGQIKPLTAVYEGCEEPIVWNRTPSSALK